MDDVTGECEVASQDTWIIRQRLAVRVNDF